MAGDRFLDLAHQGRCGGKFYLASLFLLWLLLLPFHLLPRAVSASSEGLQAKLHPYLSQILPFAVLLLGLAIALRWIHHRPFLTLITPNPQICYGRIAQGFWIWLWLLSPPFLLQVVANRSTVYLSFQPLQWLRFLPIILTGTLLQATTEELLLRGYCLQGIGQLTRNRALLTSLSGLLFAIAHVSNPEVDAGHHPGWAFCYYFACGSFAALITLADDSLELAIGWHVANNLFVSLLLQPAISILETPTIWRSSQPFNFQTGLALFTIQAAVFLTSTRRLMGVQIFR